MLDSELKTASTVTSAIGAIMGMAIVAAQVVALTSSPPPGVFYCLGLAMMALTIIFAVSTTIKIIISRSNALPLPYGSGLITLVWFLAASTYFGMALR
jgi:hypothetical protein